MKKNIVCLLAVGLSFALLTGCGKDTTKDAPTAADNSQVQESDIEKSTEASAAQDEMQAETAEEAETLAEQAEELSADQLKKIYLDFLKGNSKMKVENEKILWIDAAKEYSYEEMNQAYIEGMADFFDMATLSDAGYAFIDCGADGIPELGLRQVYTASTDQVTAYYIFKYMDGQVALVSSHYGYYRSYAAMNRYGYITYGGSGGASIYYQEFYCVDKDGKESFLYYETDDMAYSGPYISTYDFPGHEAPEEYPKETYAVDDHYFTSVTYNFTEYEYDEEKGDEEYYRNNFFTFIDEEGKYVAPDANLAKLYKDNGITFYELTEAENLVTKHLEEQGVTEQIRNGEEVQWTSLLSEGIGEYAKDIYGFNTIMNYLPGKWKLPDDSLDPNVTGVYLTVEETGEFELNISYADEYTAPAYAKGHLVMDNSEYYHPGFYLYPTTSNFSETVVRNYYGPYTIDTYLVSSNKEKMTLGCEAETVFRNLTKDGKSIFEKAYSDTVYNSYLTVFNPSEEYYLNTYEVDAAEKNVEPVGLKLLSCTENDIIDEDVWFNKVGMQWNAESYSDDTYSYRLGGVEYYGRKTMLYIYDIASGKLIKTFDFHDFIFAKGYEGNGYVDRSISYALVKDDVLYVNLYHNTYAETCPNNAYLMAVDMNSGNVIWKSKPLVSNSNNFVIIGDNIITGYGFTAEDHYLSIVNRYTGEVLRFETVKKSPNFFYCKDNVLYVRTYSYDYEFEVTK